MLGIVDRFEGKYIVVEVEDRIYKKNVKRYVELTNKTKLKT